MSLDDLIVHIGIWTAQICVNLAGRPQTAQSDRIVPASRNSTVTSRAHLLLPYLGPFRVGHLSTSSLRYDSDDSHIYRVLDRPVVDV